MSKGRLSATGHVLQHIMLVHEFAKDFLVWPLAHCSVLRPGDVNLLICLQSSYHGQLNRVLADIFNPESLTHFRDRVELAEIIEDKVNNSQ